MHHGPERHVPAHRRSSLWTLSGSRGCPVVVRDRIRTDGPAQHILWVDGHGRRPSIAKCHVCGQCTTLVLACMIMKISRDVLFVMDDYEGRFV